MNAMDKIKAMVLEQFGDAEYFNECAPDIASHGADAGFNGFIYYYDTVPFGQRLRPYVKESLEELANEFGEADKFAMMAKWKSLAGWSADDVADGWYSSESEAHNSVMNALSWYALEEVARIVCDEV